MDLERLHTTLEGARDAITVRRVYGDPIERDGVLVIPAAAVRGGGGGGGGNGPQPDGEVAEGSGFGFGMEARPIGAFIVRNGEVTWEPAVDRPREVLTYAVAGAVALLAVRALIRPRRRRGRRG